MNIKLAASSAGRKSPVLNPIEDPWRVAVDDFPVDGTAQEQLWFAVSYAVLAPSSHNTQPWRFVVHEKALDLFADLSRTLPVVDPQGRELMISCGAALYFLRLALRYFGYEPKVDLLPDVGRPDWLARVHLGAHSEIDAETILLFQSILQRSTSRHCFREEPVASDLLWELARATDAEGAWLQVVEDEYDRAALADLVAEGDRRQWADKAFRKELAEWIRPPDSSRRDGLPVSTLELGSLLSHAGPLVIRTFDLGKGHAANDLEVARHSPVLAVIGTSSDDPGGWLSAGQALARVLLRAQGDGVSASFLNQPIEVAELRPCLADVLAREGSPQLLLRMGYGASGPHTPRRAVGEVVRVFRAG